MEIYRNCNSSLDSIDSVVLRRQMKMKKNKQRFLGVLRIAAAVFLIAVQSVFAVPTELYAASADEHQWVWDEANLLSDEEVRSLNEKCIKASNEYGIGVGIITAYEYTGDDFMGWIDEMQEKYDLSGINNSAVILAVSMEERDWGITGYGDAVPMFTAYGREEIGKRILDDLSDGNYYDAFSEYVDLAAEFQAQAVSGEAYSEEHTYKEPMHKLLLILGGFLISFVVSLVVVSGWKRAMNTRIKQDYAGDYYEQDSFRLNRSSDLFLYHRITKRARPKENSQSRSGGMTSSGSGTRGKF